MANWLRLAESQELVGWSWASECTRMLERLDGVWDQQTRALIDTRRPGVTPIAAATAVNKARTQSTGFVPRPATGQKRGDARLSPCSSAATLFRALVNRKVRRPVCWPVVPTMHSHSAQQPAILFACASNDWDRVHV